MLLFLRWLLAIGIGIRLSEAFCPQGFGGENTFPDEWKIPKWPSMELEDAIKLRTVTLGGFKMKSINEEYLEGPTGDFHMQDRETYWQSSGKYFMYYCRQFDKWRIAEISAFSKNMEGQCFAFVSDALPGRDILNKSHIKGWIEVDEGQWAARPSAGVVQVGVLGDQMAEREEDDVADGEESNCTSDGDDASKEKTSTCPVMPVVRKGIKAAGKWMRRLFPTTLLGSPDDEDAIPDDDNPLFAPGGGGVDGCQPDTQDGCNFKEKFYIEKQQQATPEKRKSELQRLSKMQGVTMKEEQTQWLHARVHILQFMVSVDEKG